MYVCMYVCTVGYGGPLPPSPAPVLRHTTLECSSPGPPDQQPSRQPKNYAGLNCLSQAVGLMIKAQGFSRPYHLERTDWTL